MPDSDLIRIANGLDPQLLSLIATRRECDELLETTLRLAARRAWLRERLPGQPAANGTESAALEQLGEQLAVLASAAEAQLQQLRERNDRERQALAALEGTFEAAPSRDSDAVPMPALRFATLEFVCRRNGLISHPQQLLVTGHATGVTGRSDVYFVEVHHEHHADTLHLIAKFEAPYRAEREWGSVTRLRRPGLPPEVILPEPYSHPADGVILYRAARTAKTPRMVPFAAYFVRNLIVAPRNCALALDAALDLVGALHRCDRDESRDPLSWREAIPARWSKLWSGVPGRLVEVCRQYWGETDWEAGRDLPEVVCGRRRVPNPITADRVRDLLRRRPDPARRSRIHGDLNLTNFVTNTYQNETPQKVFLIDLAETESGRPSALDYARLEVALWQEAGPAAGGRAAEAGWVSDLIRMRDELDGRARTPGGLALPGSAGLVELIHRVRHRAYLALRPEGASREHYVLGDYFHCLYFTFLSMLRHARVAASPDQVRGLLVGAGLTLEVLDNMNAYSRTAASPRPRPWEMLSRSDPRPNSSVDPAEENACDLARV